MFDSSPIAALLTPRGRGAVATVWFRGPVELLDAPPPLFRAANGRPLAEQALGRTVFGRWGTEPAEELVVCRVAEDETEIHCHGGDAPVQRILADLNIRGVRACDWRQIEPHFPPPPLAGGGPERGGIARYSDGTSPASSQDFLADCAISLSQAPTRRTALSLLQQSQRWPTELAEWASLPDSSTGRAERQRRIAAALEWAEFGCHLTQPWKVVLTGRPNVGKSSLINALVGYARALVFDQPGTTRDVVTAATAFDGWPVELADTAGLRETAEDLEAAGIARARQALAAADLVLLVLDASEPPQPLDRELLSVWPRALRIAHKSDLPDRWPKQMPPDALKVSSLTGEGVADLAAAIVKALVPKLPPHDALFPVTRPQQLWLEASLRSAEPTGDR